MLIKTCIQEGAPANYISQFVTETQATELAKVSYLKQKKCLCPVSQILTLKIHSIKNIDKTFIYIILQAERNSDWRGRATP